MGTQDLKYETAWDRLTNKFVKPSDVNRAEEHDRNRYYSERFTEDEDKGYVLTLHRQSKEYKSKSGKPIIRKAHFVKIAENTKEYRIKTDKYMKAQESSVHKLCKDVAKDIKYIKVPSVKATIMGRELIIVPEQIIPIKFIGMEKRDVETGRIPDIIVETTILGKKQELFIEIFYKHEINEMKRRQFNFYNKNCLEVDVSDLRDNLDLSEKSLRKIIKDKIENNAYWISNRAKCLIEKTVVDKFILDINIGESYFKKSDYYYNKDKDEDIEQWYYRRLYFFKDNISNKVPENHPCYFNSDPDIVYTQDEKCTNIGKCKNCNNCIELVGYKDNDINNIHIYCDRLGLNIKDMNPIQFMNMLFEELLNQL